MPLEQESPFIKIAVLENAIEAQLLSSVLTQYEIPHRLRSYHDTACDGLFQVRGPNGGAREGCICCGRRKILRQHHPIMSSP